MPYQFPPDVQQLVRDQMAAGGYASEDELLRDALKALSEFVHSQEEINDEYRQTVTAVRDGVKDMEAGRMRPLRALIDDELRSRSAES